MSCDSRGRQSRQSRLSRRIRLPPQPKLLQQQPRATTARDRCRDAITPMRLAPRESPSWSRWRNPTSTGGGAQSHGELSSHQQLLCDVIRKGALQRGRAHGSDRPMTLSARTRAATLSMRFPGEVQDDFLRCMKKPCCRKGAQVLELGQSLTVASVCACRHVCCEGRGLSTVGGRSGRSGCPWNPYRAIVMARARERQLR
eukprot:5967883-Prymnesium_polylepis.1